jgi:polar amino acid transport system substrate-binding protein
MRRCWGLLGLLLILAALGCGRPAKIVRSFEDAETARIGVMTGSTGEALVSGRFPRARIGRFDDIMDAVTALKSGQLDALVTSFPAALQVTKKNPGFVLLPDALSSEDSAIAMRKGNPALLAAVNRVIEALEADGTLEAMKARWFKPDLAPYEEPEIPVPQAGTPLRIGVSATREPFSFVDAAGRITGHDGELARRVGAQLNRPVEFLNMKFMALIPALEAGKVDLIITGMTATDERRKSVDFSQTYYANAQVMLVRRPDDAGAAPAGSAARPRLASTADLADKRIGVLVGSAHDTFATKTWPRATILQYRTPADVALAVRAAKVDAALFDADPLREMLRQDHRLAILGEPLFQFPVAAGFARDKVALRQQFDRFLVELRESGVQADMVRRWMERRDEHMPVIANARTAPPLVVGVSDMGLPFTAVRDGRLVGFDIELAERFGASLGREVRFSNMDFGSLIAAVSTGKTELIAASIYVTEEREKQIDFSTPYYRMDTLAVALKSNVAIPAEPGADAGLQLRSPDDIADKRIGVLQGSVHDTYVHEHYPRAVVLQYRSPSDLLLAVQAGKVDAGVYNRDALVDMLEDRPRLGLVGGDLTTYPVGVGLRQGNDALRAQFNAFLARLRESGQYDDMLERWIARRAGAMPAMPAVPTNGVLVVGVVGDKGLPFTTMKNGRLTGFDIELCERFAASIGREIRWSDMEFGSLLAAVATGKVDLVVSTLVITEERERKIDFSAPYYSLGASVLALTRNIASPTAAPAASPRPSFHQRLIESFRSNILLEKRYLLIWDGMKTTVIISVFSMLFGTLLGAVVCFLRMSGRRPLSVAARCYIALLRGTPVLVLLMLIFYVMFASVDIDPVLVAVIAFGMNFAAYVSEMFRTGIEGVDRGQTEAGISLGFTPLATFVYIVLPQALQRILPVYKGEFISLVKMTSIVGYIAVQDLTKASDIIRSRTFDAFFPLVMVAILYFLISWLLTQSLEYLERATDPKSRRDRQGKA